MRNVFVLLVFCFPSLLRGQPESSTTAPIRLPGPCRSWLFPCGEKRWTCTTDKSYWQFRYGPQPGCPAIYPQTTAPPPGDCQMVDGMCQFTDVTLKCTTWLNSCQGYQCGSTSEYSAFLASPGPVCSFGGQYPQPDDLCLPINGTCQWYNPCRSWRAPGFCQSGYNCGTADQYYQFRFGPQPLCALPPPGWVEPDPPGECAVRNGQCGWYSCIAWLDWCHTYWTCGTQYEEDIYFAGPPPPCPAPPPGYQPPSQPGMCQFNVSAGQCQFMTNSKSTCPDGVPVVSCFTDPCGECPNHPNARCEVNYCGGCNAVYYDERGNNVTGLCGTTTTKSRRDVCPDGVPVVSCFTDPCGECPNYPNARCEANYCGGCNAVYYDERGNNVTDYCRTPTGGSGMECKCTIACKTINDCIGCAIIVCHRGSKCVGNPMTGLAYCDPSCDEPYAMYNCGDEQRCTLFGDCPPYQSYPSHPCLHYIRCIDVHQGCESIQCSPGFQCVSDPATGFISCVGMCEESVSRCESEQLCRIKQYNSTSCDSSPCQYPVCYNAPYVPCSSTSVSAKCDANSRCLVQNKTQDVACVQSCFEDNGGCGSDRVCINTVQECNGTYGAYLCSSQVQCLQLNGISLTCPAGWEYSTCGSACGSDCESLLAGEPVVCATVCYSGCFCPRGLVAYRDRCVDPKECYVLLSSPPPANPLPVKSTTVLLAMTLPQMTSEGFKNKTQQFLNSFQQLFADSGYSNVDVTIHAVYFDKELQVVVQVSGDQISAAKASELVDVVNNNADALSLQVKNVVAVPTQIVASEDSGLSVGSIVGIVIGSVVVLMLAVVLVTLVVVIMHTTNKQISNNRRQEFSNDMIYSKLSEESSSPVPEDTKESF